MPVSINLLMLSKSSSNSLVNNGAFRATFIHVQPQCNQLIKEFKAGSPPTMLPKSCTLLSTSELLIGQDEALRGMHRHVLSADPASSTPSSERVALSDCSPSSASCSSTPWKPSRTGRQLPHSLLGATWDDRVI